MQVGRAKPYSNPGTQSTVDVVKSWLRLASTGAQDGIVSDIGMIFCQLEACVIGKEHTKGGNSQDTYRAELLSLLDFPHKDIQAGAQFEDAWKALGPGEMYIIDDINHDKGGFGLDAITDWLEQLVIGGVHFQTFLEKADTSGIPAGRYDTSAIPSLDRARKANLLPSDMWFVCCKRHSCAVGKRTPIQEVKGRFADIYWQEPPENESTTEEPLVTPNAKEIRLCSRFAKKAGITQRRNKDAYDGTVAAISTPEQMLSQQLTTFCESLLEEHEEAIAEQIQVKVTEARTKFCVGKTLCAYDQLRDTPHYVPYITTNPAKPKKSKGRKRKRKKRKKKAGTKKEL
jgi:hypothetical protein